MKIDFQKGMNSIKTTADFVGKTSQKAAVAVKDGAVIIADKAQEISVNVQAKNREDLLKKLNPLFPNQYQSADFHIPNLIQIVDDAVRKDIEVCEGAIGWLSQEKGVEVLHLYDEAITFSGIHFLPAAICDAIYYVDPFDRNRYISLDCYFHSIQESQLAELQHIAFSLGAKEYAVELQETAKTKTSFKGAAKLKAAYHANTNAEREYTEKSERKSTSLANATFATGRKPVKPNLLWFANDNNIKNLVNMRCSAGDESGMHAYTIELKNTSTTGISQATAAKIDAAAGKLGVNSKFTTEYDKESEKKMFLKLQF